MPKRNRDDFLEKTKRLIAKRAGWLCSDRLCRRHTVGSTSDGKGVINVGTAAHICAAAPDGPRYDINQTPEQRRSADNGIWLCRNHGTAVDAKDSKFTVELLREWKAKAEKDSWQRVMYGEGQTGPAVAASPVGELSLRFRAAAGADLEVFRRTAKWPSTAVALTLKVEGSSEPVSPSVLATALTTLDDLILVAPPGMGKTTAVFQIADAVLASGNASPIVVPLADWSADSTPVLESVLKRPAFRGLTEDDLRAVAVKPGVILLLDGWNELDAEARKRLTVQVTRLQAELPELSLLISTRKQALDVPVDGARVNLLPLSEAQQLEIAQALRGDAGTRIVDQAWRSAGVRELVTIPLYMTALLTLPEESPFPTTKEEVLRRFVAVHEQDMQRAESLVGVMHGVHERFLDGLAVTATRALNTTITESDARKSVAETGDSLVEGGQLTKKPQPNTVLEALVSHHVLTRVGEPTGYSFQHQQFQEWYASHFVERLMLSSIHDTGARDNLNAAVLNQPAWEESILFACERLARGGPREQEACAAAILAAFEVDPILAAEMIFRANDAVWARVDSSIQERIRRWHTPEKVDRAVRFMIGSGRPEFLDLVWPLITHEDDQVHLRALRAGRRFRPSILGNDAAGRIAALSPGIRKHVVPEIASNSRMDGLDLATAIAKIDPDPEVKAAVVEALAFRRADRHVTEVLRSANEKVFDMVARTELVDDVPDEQVMKEIEAARARQRKKGVSAYDRLRAIVHAPGNEDMSCELTTIVAEMEIKESRQREVQLLYEARDRYLGGIANGLIQRVREGRELFYGADDLLASAGLSLEDNQLLELALADTRRDQRAESAASVLGPQAVGRIIDAVLEANKRLRDEDGKYNEAAGQRYQELQARIAHTRGASLIAAIRARSATAGNEEMAEFADLITRHPSGDSERGRPFDGDALAAIRFLAEDWGNRMLSSSDATRAQLASIASLTTRAPSVSLLPLLKRLLDEELRRYRALREAADASGWRQGKVTDEARTSYDHFHQRAFLAIGAPQTAALMREFLHDAHFGQLAAQVLASQWIAANEPREERRFGGGVDFSRVEEKRAAHARDPSATSAEAEAIFGAIEPLIADEATEEQKKHAVALGIVAVALPHGRRDATIGKLISFAPRPSRADLLRNLILSGETIDIDLVKNGIAEVFEAGKTQTWILWDGWELREWLRLLPFTNRPSEAFDVVRGLPEHRRKEDPLEGLMTAFGAAPGEDAEKVLFQLAGADGRLYGSREWREAVLRRATSSAARRLVDLAASGAFADTGADRRHTASTETR